MATKKITKIISIENGDNYVADIENIENRITQNSSNLESAKQELSNKCNEALNEAKAYTDTEKANLVKKSGDILTGGYFVRNVDNSSLHLMGGSGWFNGASLELMGKDQELVPGGFRLDASSFIDNDPTKGKFSRLQGTVDGSLTWNRKNIVRSVNGVDADAQGNVVIKDLVNIIRKNYGNDYYDDSDITSLIYAGNGEGTIRNEIANGNFARVHPGQTIKGKVTGTTYIVVGCNIYLHRGEPSLTRNHLGLIPIQLVGNSGSLLWSGQRWTEDTTKNTVQGYAPWNADNETVGKNVTCAYKDSYMAKTVIPKVINNWLKKDFEEQGISVLTFRNSFSTGFDANLPCMSYPAWKGACLYAEWADCKAVLMSEPEVYGGYRWASSPCDSHMQHLQLPLFRHRSIHEIIYDDIWLKDVASGSFACVVSWNGSAAHTYASRALRVCPLFLIA